MKLGWILRSLLLASALTSSACAELLLGDGELLPKDSGAGGAGGATGAAGSSSDCGDGLAICDGACVSLDSDSQHCGSCGRDCLGAACESGLCVPEIVASDLADPRGIAADEAFVYWTTAGGAVQRSAKSGGAVETLTVEAGAPGAIVVDDQRVYWIDEGAGRLLSMKKHGNAKAKPDELVTVPTLVGLAIDGEGLYLSRKKNKSNIERIGKGGGGPKILATDQPGTTRIAVSGDMVVWVGALAEPEDDGGGPMGYVHALKLTGNGPVFSVAEAEGPITDLTLSGSMPVWADGTAHTLRALPQGASEPVTLAEEQEVVGLSSDASNVFWTTSGGTVRRLSLSDGQVKALAMDISGAGASVVDASHVYLTRGGPNGAVVRIAK